MKTLRPALYFFLSLWILGLNISCGQKGPYMAMSVKTAFGQETISNSCAAWNDGCTLYCRTNRYTHYMRYAIKDRCSEGDIARSRCVKGNYKQVLPEGWSVVQTQDQCI